VGTPQVQASEATAEGCAGLAGTGDLVLAGSLCPLAASVWTRAEHWEPYELRGSRTVLGARGGEIPRATRLPLHRQEAIFQRQGVELPRQTMGDWMRACADLASPLYELMKQGVLGSKALQTDDTPVPVLDPELPHTRTGRIWTYVGDQEHPYTVYDYTPNRSRDGPEEFLKAFRGYLQADAYSGYDHFYKEPERGIEEVACMAHVRRKHWEAQSSDLMRSTVMLAYIRLLYEVEREARERKLDGEARRALRQEKSKPILDDIHRYLEREQPHVLPKSPEGEAIAYTLANWKALIRYCEDGDLEIDNHGAERSLRGIAVACSRLLPPVRRSEKCDARPTSRSRQNAATLCPLRPCSEINFCHFRRACLLRSRCVIAPASLPSRLQCYTPPHSPARCASHIAHLKSTSGHLQRPVTCQYGQLRTLTQGIIRGRL
jgi:hypothetical protein